MPEGWLWVVSLNFWVNYLLLAGTRQLTGQAGGNLLGGAALGAVYAAGCLAPGFGFLGQLHWHVTVLVLMSVLAFGTGCEAWKQGGVFTLLTLAAEGLAPALGRGDPGLLACAVAVRLLGWYALSGRVGRRLLPVEIQGQGKRLCLTALRDTGNELRDPVTGEAVLVVGCSAASALTGLTVQQLKNPLDTLSAGGISGLRLVPYRGVGVEQGMLLAMRLPRVRIAGREGPRLVAFSPTELGGERYQALTGGIG